MPVLSKRNVATPTVIFKPLLFDQTSIGNNAYTQPKFLFTILDHFTYKFPMTSFDKRFTTGKIYFFHTCTDKEKKVSLTETN